MFRRTLRGGLLSPERGLKLPGVTRAVVPTRWEKRVLVRIRRGDPAALAELFDQFSASVFGFAHRITADRLVAESITRSVFLDVWQNPRRLAGCGLRERLTELARTAAVRWRDEHPVPASRPAETRPVPRVSAYPDAEEFARANAARCWAVESLDTLPADNRALVEAVLFDGQLLAKAAAAQGLGPSAAAGRLGQALQGISGRTPAR